MPRPGVTCKWNADKTGSVVTCTHPECPDPVKEYAGPKAVGDEQARWRRQRHRLGLI